MGYGSSFLAVTPALLGAQVAAEQAQPSADAPDDPNVVVLGGYKLRPTGAGGYLYEDGRFRVRIGGDGTSRFEDKHVDARRNLDRMLDPKELKAWRRDTQQRLSPDRPDPTVHAVRERDDPFYRQHGLTSGRGGAPVPASGLASLLGLVPKLVGTSGTADVSDAVARARGRDPYAYEKTRFLEATFDLRTRLAADARKRDLRQALYSLPALLDRVWADERFSHSERMRILELLRDECDPTQPGGEQARQTIEAFRHKRIAAPATE